MRTAWAARCAGREPHSEFLLFDQSRNLSDCSTDVSYAHSPLYPSHSASSSLGASTTRRLSHVVVLHVSPRPSSAVSLSIYVAHLVRTRLVSPTLLLHRSRSSHSTLGRPETLDRRHCTRNVPTYYTVSGAPSISRCVSLTYRASCTAKLISLDRYHAALTTDRHDERHDRERRGRTNLDDEKEQTVRDKRAKEGQEVRNISCIALPVTAAHSPPPSTPSACPDYLHTPTTSERIPRVEGEWLAAVLHRLLARAPLTILLHRYREAQPTTPRHPKQALVMARRAIQHEE